MARSGFITARGRIVSTPRRLRRPTRVASDSVTLRRGAVRRQNYAPGTNLVCRERRENANFSDSRGALKRFFRSDG